MTNRKAYRDVDCYGSVEVEIKDPTNPDGWIDCIFEIGYTCTDEGHGGIFDPISGYGEPPCGPELEEVEWRLIWPDGSFTRPTQKELERIIPQYEAAVESCYEYACEDLGERW